jgi:hypothetical protein
MDPDTDKDVLLQELNVSEEDMVETVARMIFSTMRGSTVHNSIDVLRGLIQVCLQAGYRLRVSQEQSSERDDPFIRPPTSI